VFVLRLGHRPERDKRITTHVGLVARAFGASGLVLADIVDDKVVRSLRKVVNNWGGEFEIIQGVSAKKFINEWRKHGGIVILLTMYGLPVDYVIPKLKISNKDKLIIVGAEKVPIEYYELADYNIAIGHQPHSEVAALAIFLDRLFEGRELYMKFRNAKIQVEPCEKGKKVIKKHEERKRHSRIR